MDADTILEGHFIARMIEVMRRPGNEHIGALSSAFIGKTGLAKNWRQHMMMWPQAAEYARYQDSAVRGEASCISGTGNMLRVDALDVLRADSAREMVWRTDTLVEDYELTLALNAAGWECRKSKKFIVYTDLMPTVYALWRQRIRWQRGTIDELRRYGLTPYTRWDWAKQVAHGMLMLLHVAGFGFCAWSIWYNLSGGHQLRFSETIFICLGAIALKQAYHLREMGWRSVLVALLIVPEEAYNLLRHGWWLRGLWLSLRCREQQW
jgi:biofilm PGA synthesis N-glycosyltransferase PgaC